MSATIRAVTLEQIRYVKSLGGMFELREGDDTYNDLNRKIILAYKKEHPDAVIGRINEDSGMAAVFMPIEEGQLANFCCDFVLPKADELLEEQILGWRRTGDHFEEMYARIKTVGGQNLVWY